MGIRRALRLIVAKIQVESSSSQPVLEMFAGLGVMVGPAVGGALYQVRKYVLLDIASRSRGIAKSAKSGIRTDITRIPLELA